MVLAVDFNKGFDSVKRETLVSVLQDYKVPGGVVDYLLRSYCEGRTIIGVGDKEIEMEVESGIRQGCTVSPALFRLVTR